MTSNKSSNRNPRLRKDLLLGLEHLRSEAREISRLYAANLQRDMVQLIDFVADSGKLSALADMKEKLDDLDVKPEKGRRKDLRRIERAIRSMMKIAFSKNVNA